MQANKTLALLCTLICIPLASCSRVVAHANTSPPEGVPVHIARAVSQDVPLEIAAVGNVEAVESVEVKPRVAGQIKEVAFTEGQNVTKGQLLFTIDRDTLSRQQAQQQAELSRDIAMEQQATAIAARDAASQKQSQSEADTAVKLGELGVLSGQSVKQAVTASDTTRASLQADKSAIAAAAGAINADRARLAQTQLQLSFAQVVAPIAGRAGAAMVKAGNVIRENDTTLVTLLQLAPIRVTFGVPEQALAEVQRLSSLGPLEVEAGPGDVPLGKGRLDFIDNTVDPATGTIRLKATFPNTDGALWPGEFVNVRLRLRVDANQLVVPQSAIQQGLEGKYAWRIQASVATMVPVTVLRTYRPPPSPQAASEVAVLGSGLRPGDMIVTEGQLRLTPGARVSPIDVPSSSSPHDSLTNNTVRNGAP
ncbi:efflux RND transporter periplasmic adaptor subunit [Tunturibacter empetritectus]|uniref:Multidrug efflux system membrane fusion protein n=1 Tax=Tunturiibacter empetritectus TaxID=3069691 RepID=A0A7W8IJ04_9BACT|nr:efflux RND transporter periplasmic adaptor subunit [Edaphobacter lichenicola]MBB5317974.1 multidrug efflux system membrane fusion protein [Edaphobacter lichenicola]